MVGILIAPVARLQNIPLEEDGCCQVLSPDMQNAQHTNIGSQVLEVASDSYSVAALGRQSRSYGQPLVPQHDCGEFMP